MLAAEKVEEAKNPATEVAAKELREQMKIIVSAGTQTLERVELRRL